MRCGFRDEGEVGLTVDTRRKIAESIKGFWKGQFGPRGFDTGTWWFIDFFLLIMLWPIYMMFGEPFPVEDKWFIGLGLVYTNFLILQGYLYIRYRKEGL